MSPDTIDTFDAVVLAGGEGRRLGGVSKPDVIVAGRRMLDRVLDAVRHAHDVVVVGPASVVGPGVRSTLEDPPSGGPAAGIGAGLAALGAEGDVPVVVLACDAPLVGTALPTLLAALATHADADGATLVAADGHRQPLAAVYRRPALRAALDARAADGGLHGCSMRRLLEPMRLVDVADTTGAARDGDTWDAVAELDVALGGSGVVTTPEPNPGRPWADGEDRGGSMSDASTKQPVGSELYQWVAELVEELGVDPDVVDVDAVLDLAREAASGVARPAVPLTAFLVGCAVGARGGGRATFDEIAARVTDLARDFGEPR